jgi:hypothetical protein
MNYLLATIFAAVGITIVTWNKPLSDHLGAFYARRFLNTFDSLARFLRWDDPKNPFMGFVYRGFVIALGIIFLLFAVAALFGTNFVGPPAQADALNS